MKLAACLLLAGCNAFYGLDGTQSRDAFVQFADEDQDGVADERDNCRSVANASQADGDRDGLGDICDGCEACPPCAVGPNHDEDGDHIADGCDPCPALASTDGDADGDGVHDACDPSSAAQRHILFDGFGEASPHWIEIGARWDVANDQVTAKSGADSPYQYLHDDTVLVDGTDWSIELAARPTTTPMRTVGIYLIPAASGTGTTYCWLARTSNGRMQLFTPTQVLEIDPLPNPVTLRFTARNPVGPSHEVVCSIVGTPHQVVYDGSAASYPNTIRLFADRSGVAFDYIDVIAP